jgi:hypothetical protein
MLPPEPTENAAPLIPGLPPTEQVAAQTASVDQAYAEFEQLSRNVSPEELQREADRLEHHRNQRFKQNFEWIAIIALWLSFAAIAVIGVVWLWHLGAPAKYRWLAGEDVSHLQSIITAGLLVGIVGNHFKKRIG